MLTAEDEHNDVKFEEVKNGSEEKYNHYNYNEGKNIL
jgi:hypothetical protein